MFILTVVLLVAFVGSLPTWPRGKKWGYSRIVVMSVVMVIVLTLFATVHLRAR
jgi:hypothetical protein